MAFLIITKLIKDCLCIQSHKACIVGLNIICIISFKFVYRFHAALFNIATDFGETWYTKGHTFIHYSIPLSHIWWVHKEKQKNLEVNLKGQEELYAPSFIIIKPSRFMLLQFMELQKHILLVCSNIFQMWVYIRKSPEA